MKRILLIGLASFAAIVVATIVTISTVNANSPKLSDLMIENLEILSECEHSMKIDGPLIIVNVCYRKTDKYGEELGVWCNAEANVSCVFTNVTN